VRLIAGLIFFLGASACGEIRPIMDLDASTIDGAPSIDAPVACNTDGSEDSCQGDTLLTCNATGTFDSIQCSLGCDSTEIRCKNLTPAVAPNAMQAACSLTTPFSTGAHLSFDTDNGQIKNEGNGDIIRPALSGVDEATQIGFVLVPQGGGAPTLAVFTFAGLTLGAEVHHEFLGTHPVALVSCGNVNIAGVLDLGGTRTIPGSGGARGGATAENGLGIGGGTAGVPYCCGNDDSGGGGGGGYGGAGGAGGSGITGGGPGGNEWGSPSMQPLLGGSGGGGGGQGGPGGGGGGAIYIGTNQTISFDTNSGIDVGGGGGEPGGQYGGGGGGGSGGAIFLEAATFDLKSGATFASNGGSGADSSNGGNGVDGLLGTGAADGSHGGGVGGAASSPAGEGGAYVSGGGGSVGRMRFNSAAGTVSFADVVLSPSAEASDAGDNRLVQVGQVATD
jgi:hypothetical protein